MPAVGSSRSLTFGVKKFSRSKPLVQHRSKVFMNEQVKNIKESQNELRLKILELEAAKSPEAALQCSVKVEEAKEIAERDILILQILNKLNTELLYARADLDDALDYREGDINASRKRVMWLEDRMTGLCGKSGLGDPTTNESIKKLDTNYNINNFGAGDGTELHTTSPQGCTADSRAMNDDEVEISLPMERYTPDVLTEKNEQAKTDVTATELDAEHDDQEQGGLIKTETGRNILEEGENTVVESEISSIMENSQPDDDKEDEQSQTCMTEVSGATKSKVTIISPKREDTRQDFLNEIKDDGRDLAHEYWISEHHRFEYGNVGTLLEMDPSSYHQMGLAVPGSFLNKRVEGFEDLPWRGCGRGGDIHDIHKVALDKLAVKVYGLHEKLYEATMLSVKPLNRDDSMMRQGSFFHDLSFNTGKDGMTPSLTGKPTVSPSPSEQSSRLPTAVASPVPTINSKQRLVFYPKHISAPERLPLTRTNPKKELPRLANYFSEPNPDKRNPAVRVVDQRNLLEETKLTLYTDRSTKRQLETTSPERKFRMMLAIDKTKPGSESSSKLMTPCLTTVGTVTKDEEKAISWMKIKPKHQNQEFSGLRWERVKTLIHSHLVSENVEERRDAAKHLGLLKCGDAVVFFALKECLKKDQDQRVRYEAAKSLILIGCWEEEILQLIIKYLVMGNIDIRHDLIATMMESKNVQYVDKKLPAFPELVKVLSHFCCNPDPADKIAFEAAVLLGMLCVCDDNAKIKLLAVLESIGDTHMMAKSLETLVKQLNCTDLVIVRYIEDLLKSSPVWKYRKLACDLFITLGPRHACKETEVNKIFDLLDRRLWDDPSAEVRLAAAKALTALGMFSKACDKVEKRLEDPIEDIRAQAVKSVGTLGMKNEKIIRLLLEMLELDPSDYVRLMIIRTFATLNMTDKRVLRSLRERERTEGPLARESRRTLDKLEPIMSSAELLRRKTSTPKYRGSRLASPTDTPQFVKDKDIL